MFCQKCGSEIKDSAKFCNVCGTQVAVISHAQPTPACPQENKQFLPDNAYRYEVVQYPQPQREMDPQRKVKIVKLVFALVCAFLQTVSMLISFFVPIVDTYSEGSVIDLITNEFFMEYAIAKDGILAIFFMLLGCLICSAASFIGIQYSEKIKMGWIYAGMGFYVIAFSIAVFNDYMEIKGVFILAAIIYAASVVAANMQTNIRSIESGKSLSSGHSMFAAAPRHITAQISYDGNVPDMESLDNLIDKTCLREHLYKTHPDNQLFIKIQQLINQKFAEMTAVDYHANRRIFNYTDNKNNIKISLSYSENHVLECDMIINM